MQVNTRTTIMASDVAFADPRPAAAPRRARLGAAVIAAAGLIALTGCSSGTQSAASTSATPSSAPASTPPASSTPPSAPATPSSAPASTPAQAPSTPVPAGSIVLGQLAGLFAHGSGFGQTEPTRIFNGGDPTGLVTNISWQAWGRDQATGTGQAEWVGPHQSVAAGTEEPAVIVAFSLGTCSGKQMYRAVEWYFPQHHQSFDPNRYENICTGSYVPSS